jgi:hypothetical protein
MKDGNPKRRGVKAMKHLKPVERKKVALTPWCARVRQARRRSNELYVKHATAALDAWETIRADRENE